MAFLPFPGMVLCERHYPVLMFERYFGDAFAFPTYGEKRDPTECDLCWTELKGRSHKEGRWRI